MLCVLGDLTSDVLLVAPRRDFKRLRCVCRQFKAWLTETEALRRRRFALKAAEPCTVCLMLRHDDWELVDSAGRTLRRTPAMRASFATAGSQLWAVGSTIKMYDAREDAWTESPGFPDFRACAVFRGGLVTVERTTEFPPCFDKLHLEKRFAHLVAFDQLVAVETLNGRIRVDGEYRAQLPARDPPLLCWHVARFRDHVLAIVLESDFVGANDLLAYLYDPRKDEWKETAQLTFGNLGQILGGHLVPCGDRVMLAYKSRHYKGLITTYYDGATWSESTLEGSLDGTLVGIFELTVL